MRDPFLKNHRMRILSVSVPVMVLTSNMVAAQGPGDVPGLSPLQQNTVNGIVPTCLALNALPEQGRTGDQQDFLNQCNPMVDTGFALQESEQGGSLDLTREEFGGAAQNLATEELGTTSRVATSTLSNQMAAVSSHLLTLHNLGLGGAASSDEMSGLLNERLSVFANGIGGFGELDASELEDAADFSAGGFLIGVDYRITDHFIAGIAGSYTHLDSDYENNINVSGGGIEGDFGNLSMYASYDINNFYMDGVFAYGWSSYDIQRSVFIQNNNTANNPSAGTPQPRTAKSSPDGRQISVAFNAGYNYQHEALNIRPYIGVNYYDGQIDAYTEQGAGGLNLTVNEQEFDSLQTVLGTQISYAFGQSFGVIVPFIDFSWHHEFQNDAREYTYLYSVDLGKPLQRIVTDTPDRDFFLLGGGVSTVLQEGTQLFFNYQALLGYRRVSSHGFSAGFRMTF